MFWTARNSVACLAFVFFTMTSVIVRADYDVVTNSTIPKKLQGIRVDEKLGSIIPTDIEFVESKDGSRTSLQKLLDEERPVLLTLNYSNCPGLCVSQLNGLLVGINEIGSLKLGRDFTMVSISIDPSETSDRAKSTQKRYSQDLFDQHDQADWHFWTGSEASIQSITEAVGFRYTYDSKLKQYNHPAMAVLISPQGKITRYLYEIGYTGNTLKMAIIEAGEGRVGTSLDMLVLWCAHYDPLENRYSMNARRLLSIAAGIFVVIGGIACVPFWLSHRNKQAGKVALNGDSTVSPIEESIERVNSSHDRVGE